MWKPTRHERIRQHEAKKLVKRVEKRKAERERIALDQKYRTEAYWRDHGMCRATGKWLPLHDSNITKVAHSHHVIFRSRGPELPDSASRRITVSFSIHEMIHALHCLTVEGDPDTCVTFTQTNPETGRVVRVWESRI